MYKLKVVNTNQGLSSGIEKDRKHNYAENLLEAKSYIGPRTWLGFSEPAK